MGRELRTPAGPWAEGENGWLQPLSCFILSSPMGGIYSPECQVREVWATDQRGEEDL